MTTEETIEAPNNRVPQVREANLGSKSHDTPSGTNSDRVPQVREANLGSKSHDTPSRTPIQPRRAILAMPEYHPPLDGRTALRLDFNENTHAPSPRVREALAKLTLESFTIYPERAPVERTVAAHLGLAPDQVLLTNAVDEAIHLVCFTFLEEGDEALFSVPSFFMYDVNATAMGANVLRIQADETLAFPYDRFLAAITPRTKLIILASPNNPTGTVMSRAQIHSIASAAPHAVVMVDEAYFHFHGETVIDDLQPEAAQKWVPHLREAKVGSESSKAEPGSETISENRVPQVREANLDLNGGTADQELEASHAAAASTPQNLIVARTFSKAYGLANLRAGLLAGPANLMAHIRKASSPYNVNGVALAAVEACIADTDYLDWYVAQIREGRIRIEKALDGMHVPRWPSHANFVLMRIGPKHKQLIAAMRARGVLLRDRSGDPGLAGCVRITVGVEDQIDTAIAALRDALAEIAWTPAEINAPETQPKEAAEYE